MTDVTIPHGLRQLFDHLAEVAILGQGLPDEGTPMGMLTREFLANNWANCRNGLLQQSNRIRVWPEPSPFPRVFKFEVDRQFKRKTKPDAAVELVAGPIRGTIFYRPDVLLPSDYPCVAVALDADQAFFHPNFSRRKNFLCLGELPSTAFPLDLLLENLIFPILTYQNRRPAHAFDREAAAYFALDPDAMTGLEPVEPLY